MSTLLRRGLVIAATATVALGATIAPATAAPQATTAQADVYTTNGGPVGLGPDVQILGGHVLTHAPLGAWYVVPAGRSAELYLRFQLGDERSYYSDVHYSTSNPGTVLSPCTGASIQQDVQFGGYKECLVGLPALKPGASAKYWVTMTGKRNGKPFSITRSTTVLAPNVQVSIYVDGRNVTGLKTYVPSRGTSKVQYVVTNRTAQTLTNLRKYPAGGHACTIGSVAPGKTGSCTYAIDRQHFVGNWSGMEDLAGVYGSTTGIFAPAGQTVVTAR